MGQKYWQDVNKVFNDLPAEDEYGRMEGRPTRETSWESNQFEVSLSNIIVC